MAAILKKCICLEKFAINQTKLGSYGQALIIDALCELYSSKTETHDPTPEYQLFSPATESILWVMQSKNVSRLSVMLCFDVHAVAQICLNLKRLQKLCQFTLKTNSTIDGMALTSGLQNSPELEILDLSDNSIDANQFKSYTFLSKLTNLKELYLNGNNLGDEGTVFLSSCFYSLVNLQKLGLADNKVWKDGSKALATNLCHCTQLQQLNLQHNWIDHEDALALVCTLKNCTKFTTLILSNNFIPPSFSENCHFEIKV